MNQLSILLLCLISLFSFLITGCGKKETYAEQAAKEKILLVGNGAELSSLDPAFAYTVRDGHIMHAIFESLLVLDIKTLEPRPGVATSWDISPDGKTYTFHLRKDARFSNGEKITANDFVFNIKRILSPLLGSPNAILLYDIKNSKKYNAGIINDFNEVGIKVTDDYTLEFQLENPNPFFPSIAASWFFVPLHEKTLEKFDAVESTNDEWLKPSNFVSNGPFVLETWRPDDYIEVGRNPYYWDASNVKLNKVRFYIMVKETTPGGKELGLTEEAAFRKGLLHVAENLTPRQAAQYLQSYFKNDYNLRSFDVNGVYTYIFNVDVPPLNDVRVRQALSIALDRFDIINNIANHVFNDGRKPAYNLIPSVIKGYEPIYYIREDLQKARKLLAEAGYPYGEGFPELTLLFNNEKFHHNIAEAVKDMWWRYLNIKINFSYPDTNTMYKRLHNRDFEIIRLNIFLLTLDPLGILQNFTKDSIRIPTSWSNPKYDSLLEAARQTTDIPTRFKHLAAAEAILLEEAVVIPISFPRHNIMVHPLVKNWQTNPSMINYYQFIDLEIPKEEDLKEEN